MRIKPASGYEYSHIKLLSRVYVLDRSSVVRSSCVSKERFCLNPCWFSFKILCESRRLMMLDTTMCSSILETTDVKDTGR